MYRRSRTLSSRVSASLAPTLPADRLGLAASSFICGPPFLLPALGIASGGPFAAAPGSAGWPPHGQRKERDHLSPLCDEWIIPPAYARKRALGRTDYHPAIRGGVGSGAWKRGRASSRDHDRVLGQPPGG